MKTVFVVLHYCVPEVTKDCIKSLLSLDGDKEIVVVDNASPDGSGKVLQSYYEKESCVHVILNKVNGGFADGNNLGYRYAKQELHADIIVVLNNDTLIKDKAFLNKLCKDESLSSFHIIAPDIITYKGIHQNPYRRGGISKKDLIRDYLKTTLSYIFHSLPFLYKIKSPKEVMVDNYMFKVSIKDITPHGAAVIYTKRWIENESFAFYPGTFLYGEEDLLYLYSRRNNYRIVYNPDLQITHLEDKSTNSTHSEERQKKIFQDRVKLQSIKLTFKFINNKI